MEEPFSLFAAQVLMVKYLMAPRIPVVFFTWNNLSLKEYDYRPSFLYRNIARHTLPRMDYALTANSDAIGVLRKFGFKKPARTVGYGVDVIGYDDPDTQKIENLRKRLGIKSDATVIGYVGRLIDMTRRCILRIQLSLK